VEIEGSLLRFTDEAALAIFRLTINSNFFGWITGSPVGYHVRHYPRISLRSMRATD
jgi:hypothetical protein